MLIIALLYFQLIGRPFFCYSLSRTEVILVNPEPNLANGVLKETKQSQFQQNRKTPIQISQWRDTPWINRIVVFNNAEGYPPTIYTYCGKIIKWYGGDEYGVLVNLRSGGAKEFYVKEGNMTIIYDKDVKSCP